MNSQPNLKIEFWPIENVINYARNARLHSDSQVSQIAASIKEFGFINPCLVDEQGTLIAGHGRVMACKTLGIGKVPVIKLGHLSENQIRALRIADNQIALGGSWSADLLQMELKDLQLSGFDMPLLGFDDAQLVSFIAGLGDGTESRQQNIGNLAERFGIPPFSILNAREGWWQDRKRGWLALGIQSELGRGDAPPGDPNRPTAGYSTKARGDGAGRVKRKPNAIPGGAPMPLDRAKNRDRPHG
jgi:hypothetical protein